MSELLSKTLFVAGCQCLDLLWWTVNEPDAPELVPDLSLEHVFQQGHEVGELARSYVPGGILIDLPHSAVDARLTATREALESGAPVVYEATFVEDSVYVAVDILESADGGFNLIEVKSTTRVKDEHIPDLLAYCERDTVATVRLVERLKEMGEGRVTKEETTRSSRSATSTR